MSESGFWKYMSKNVKHMGHFNRIESHDLSVGFPDVEYCIASCCSTIELKYGANEVPEIRPSQVRWFNKRIKHGGNPWLFAHIIVKGEDHYLLFKGKHVKILCKSDDLAEWFSLSHRSWTGKVDWSSLIRVLQTKLPHSISSSGSTTE